MEERDFTQEYNAYVQKLKQQDLTPYEYESLVKQWCESHNY